VKILEVSPSEKWLKIQDCDGRKYWKAVSAVQFVETLAHVEKSKEVNV
jgi:hypothetical protein